jgi:hypothetical protein
MGINIAKYDNDVRDFNQKYGVNFDMLMFTDAKKRMETNEAYKKIFKDIYKNAIIGFADKKNDGFSLQEMLIHYDKILQTYHKDCLKLKVYSDLRPLGGWTTDRAVKSLKNVAEQFNGNRIDFAKQRYMAGKLPIRDMMAYANKAFENGNTPDRETATVIAAYAKGLEETNKSRSIFWKMRHPIRNNAEQKYSKLMQDMLKRTDFSRSANEHAESDAIFDPIKKAMESCVNEHNALNQYMDRVLNEDKAPEKSKMMIGEASMTDTSPNVQKISESKTLSVDSPNLK